MKNTVRFPAATVSTIILLCLCCSVCRAGNPVVFEDDFESYDIEYASDFSINDVPTDKWTSNKIEDYATRIFVTGNFGGTRLWISLVDGTTITSRGIEIEPNTRHMFSAVLLSETNTGTRQVECTYNLKMGQNAGAAVSLTGGPVSVTTHGDNWGTDNTKEDNVFSYEFESGQSTPDDKLFIEITRVSDIDSGAWFGVDDVRIVKVQPIDIMAATGTLSEGSSATFSYDIYVRDNPTSPVKIAVRADDQVKVNGQSEVILTFVPPVDPKEPQRVTVAVIDDNIVEGYHYGRIKHISSSSLEQWNSLDLMDVQINIEDNDFPVEYASDVFLGGQEGPDGTSYYRIPGMAVAADGTVLTFAEGRRSVTDPGAAGYPIDMVMKRSLDNGRTWSNLVVMHRDSRFDYSDPRPITDFKTGHVHLLYMQWPDNCGQACVPVGLDENSSVVFLQTSEDNGLTWSGPKNINSQVKDPSWRALNCGPGHGIQLHWQTKAEWNGRILAPAHYNGNTGISIFSDDGGKNWNRGNAHPFSNLNESEVVELTNGDLLWDGRQWSGGYRQNYISHDAGQTWEYNGTADIGITTVDCGLARYSARRNGDDRDRLVFSGPLGNPPGSGSGRYNMAIWTSYDEGKTYINPVQIDNGFGAYSAIQKLADGNVGVLYEETGSTYIRFVSCSMAKLENGPHHSDVTQYDGFGNPVDQRRGGVGWSGSWTGSGSFTRDFAEEIGAASISYQGFPFNTQSGRLDTVETNVLHREFADTIDLRDKDNVYVSMLISRALDLSRNDDEQEMLQVTLIDASGSDRVGWGVTDNERFFVGIAGQDTTVSAEEYDINNTYCMVAKINYDEKRVYLRGFRSGSDIIPIHEKDADWEVSGDLVDIESRLNGITISAGTNSLWSIDELRIGTSYEAVVSNAVEICSEYLPGDINKDCSVNILDLIQFSMDWLGCTDPGNKNDCVQ